MAREPEWWEPTDAQKLSDRTVFRFQEFANLLKKDLESLPQFKNRLSAVLFVQRDWEHSIEKKQGRFYKANLCATYNLSGGAVLQELKTALGGNEHASITKGQLEALFEAHATVRNQSTCFPEFETNLQHAEKNYRSSQSHREAHALLVAAASVIPYQGQLPSAFDLRLRDDQTKGNAAIGYWFTGTQKDFTYRRLTKLNGSGEQPLRLEQVRDLSFTTELSGLTENLRSLFDRFLNPLLIGGAPSDTIPAYQADQQPFSGFAFPCYERTESDLYAGSFLGWLFFKFGSSEPPDDLDAAWDPFRFAINHFASRILRAIVDELLGDYVRDILEPDQAFAAYLQRFEGWIVTQDKSSPTQTLHLPNKDEQWIEVFIRPKWDTIHETGKALPDSVLLRCHRFHQGLIFVHENSQIENLAKYRRMLEMLQRPLEGLAQSLGNMQRDTQELRAVLYAPAKALFESHGLISDLFDEGKEIRVSELVPIIINHSLNYAGGTDDDTAPAQARKGSLKDGQCLVAYAISKIFGKEADLRSLKSRSRILLEAAEILQDCEQRDEFRQLAEDLRSLIFSDGFKSPAGSPPSTLASSLQSDPGKILGRLKRAIFDPFKPDDIKWDAAALRLAVRRYVKHNVPAILSLPNGEIDLVMPPSWTPVSLNMILAFLMDVGAEFCARNDTNKIIELCFEDDGSRAEKRVSTYKRIKLQGTTAILDQAAYPDGLSRLRSLIKDYILSEPRDWRVFETEVGNFRKPYIDLASRMMGIHTEGRPGEWRPVKVADLCNVSVCNDVFAVTSAGRRFRAYFSKTVSDNDTVILGWEPLWCAPSRLRAE